MAPCGWGAALRKAAGGAAELGMMLSSVGRLCAWGEGPGESYVGAQQGAAQRARPEIRKDRGPGGEGGRVRVERRGLSWWSGREERSSVP